MQLLQRTCKYTIQKLKPKDKESFLSTIHPIAVQVNTTHCIKCYKIMIYGDNNNGAKEATIKKMSIYGTLTSELRKKANDIEFYRFYQRKEKKEQKYN